MMHSRDVSVKNDHLHIVRGNIADRDFVDAGTRDVTRVIQMATCKDIPELVIDVTAKGMFWLLEAFHERRGGTSCGDAAMRRLTIASRACCDFLESGFAKVGRCDFHDPCLEISMDDARLF